MKEEWRLIPECKGEYEVSNTGKVRNCKTGTIRVPKKMPNGYMRIHYQINGKRADRYLHRLVADAFCVHPEGCNVVNHLDNNQENNHADNLEWTTQRENVYYGMRQGRYKCKAISVLGYKDGKHYLFDSINDAYKKTGCGPKSIRMCCLSIFKQSKGYQWKYAEVV